MVVVLCGGDLLDARVASSPAISQVDDSLVCRYPAQWFHRFVTGSETEQRQTLEGEPGPCGIYVDTSHTDRPGYRRSRNYCLSFVGGISGLNSAPGVYTCSHFGSNEVDGLWEFSVRLSTGS